MLIHLESKVMSNKGTWLLLIVLVYFLDDRAFKVDQSMSGFLFNLSHQITDLVLIVHFDTFNFDWTSDRGFVINMRSH